MNNKLVNAKLTIPILTFLLVIILSGLWFLQTRPANDSLEIKNPGAGLRDRVCQTSKDCAGICGNNNCLRPSCIKSEGILENHCACLGVCK
ncbi:MAG: hypothetical protein WCV50_00385 [Patescibacteria group bacterium]|jgi:hypothetical protein